MPDTTELLQQGIALAKAGRREEARTILLQVVEQDERNESAWLWLSGLVDSDDDKAIALENVLTLNPNNEWAKRGLQMLGRPLPGE
jgi:Flp pilus assembly protein TadD